MIGVGGLVLARFPEETRQQRNSHYRKATMDQMQAVDNDLMREQHPSMPIENNRQSRVTFGGNKSAD